MATRTIHCLLAGMLLLAISGCAEFPTRQAAPGPAAQPPQEPHARASHPVAAAAQELVGTPYRYGGDDPRGFDCSGLVYYVHGRLGERVPRTVEAQLDAARRVSRSELRPGDLVFFEFGWKPSHVGIYVGDHRFVHAPSSGGRVRYGDLRQSHWRRNFHAAGRLVSDDCCTQASR